MKKYWQIKPWLFIVVLLVLVISILFAFGNNNNSGSGVSYDMGISAPAPAMDVDSRSMLKSESAGNGAMTTSTTQATERMIIKNGNLSLVVDDVRKSSDDIIKYTEEKGGFLVSSNVSKEGIDLDGYITVRIPSSLLESTMAYIKEMGEVQNEHIDGQDITEEYTDLESKLGNLEATEQQFLQIMKKAVKVEDVLAVQRELGYVRENIEITKGRIKYLKESVDLSSLTVYLSTNPATLPVINEEDQWKPLAILKDALRSLLDTGKTIVNGIIWIGVYLPIITIVLFVAWLIRRRIRRNK
ncbi:DUF4349 domain-containing protein [Candidatus Gracilibacteria bacterium]|nr:DUF4349 domain-containing protein [Candidatus Gracilibacteria bacterium]